ncbi:hypothetical protein AERO_14905 [Aeromicrobium fastidiosum]|uniref:hypothetical protein n=1 Tax=Aeromicrobium fastidiosum TaxID=52699 RepID=UPI0020231B80|nr:hypothetical protein [Aeromicrobium fastidiosum]MCL8252678.1 hypothetical protein [Aeromicrobium fastidiosum]
MSRPGFLSEVSWLQVTVSALAAVTAAWIASSLGVAGTLIGAALGSSVVTISSAFYGRTLDKGKTLIVQTASGTIVQAPVDDGDIGEAFEKVEEAEGSPVTGAQVVDDADGEAPRRLHWKTIGATTAIVLAISLGAMGTYELVTGESYGVRGDNARIGNPLGGSHDSKGDDPAPDDSPTPEPTASTTTPAPPATTPAPAPTATTPAPSATTPAPTPTPTATTPTPTATPTPTSTPKRAE